MRRAIRSQSLIDRIIRNGVSIGMVETPKGNISIYGLCESRCGCVKECRYISFPGDLATFYQLTKRCQEHWKASGWHVNWFNR